jgi:hypothetical protein
LEKEESIAGILDDLSKIDLKANLAWRESEEYLLDDNFKMFEEI